MTQKPIKSFIEEPQTPEADYGVSLQMYYALMRAASDGDVNALRQLIGKANPCFFKLKTWPNAWLTEARSEKIPLMAAVKQQRASCVKLLAPLSDANDGGRRARCLEKPRL